MRVIELITFKDGSTELMDRDENTDVVRLDFQSIDSVQCLYHYENTRNWIQPERHSVTH